MRFGGIHPLVLDFPTVGGFSKSSFQKNFESREFCVQVKLQSLNPSPLSLKRETQVPSLSQSLLLLSRCLVDFPLQKHVVDQITKIHDLVPFYEENSIWVIKENSQTEKDVSHFRFICDGKTHSHWHWEFKSNRER